MNKRRGLCSFLAVLCATFAPMMSLANEQVLQLDHAEFVLDDAESPPPDSAAWKPQQLPDNWSVSRPQASGFGWYRIRFTLQENPNTLYAVYAPKIALNAAFHMNGQHIGSGGSFRRGSIARNFNRPQFFVVAPQLLKVGSNTLHVRLWARAEAGHGLGSVKVGPEHELRMLFERRYLFQVQLPQIAGALVGFVGILLLFLWMRRAHDTVYGYRGIVALLGCLFVAHFVIRDPPISGPQWDMLTLTALGWFVAFYGLFVLRFTGRRWQSLEVLLWLNVLLSPLIWALGGLANFRFAVFIEFLANGVFFTICIGILVHFWWRSRTVESVLVIVAIGVNLTLAGHDVAILARMLPFDSIFLIPYGASMGSVLIGGLLVNRFVRNLNDYEKLNVELEGRVAQKHAELEENYKRMNQLERQSAIVEERQRIMRDMHDGLGAQLISTLSLVEHGDLAKEQLAAVLRECLDDLRLTIDSLESTENDLLTVLGNFRYRLEPRLKSSGIQLDWQVKDLPKLACLTPQNVLHVLRILQEAFTNILKHARDNTVKVETGVAGMTGKVYVSVSDNGIGLSNEHPGHGLANMRRRAQAIGGTLDIASAATGTMITLSLPNA